MFECDESYQQKNLWKIFLTLDKFQKLLYICIFFNQTNGIKLKSPTSPPTNPVALVVTLCVFYIE